MEFIDEKIQKYSEDHTSPESTILYEINRNTHLNVLKPRMLSGHLQGQFLRMICLMMRPKKILEIGTYTGYSAICMAEGLQKGGKLITIDINEELEDKVRSDFNKSEFGNQIDYRIGDAIDIIPQLDSDIDFVFIDADKKNYLNYYHLLIDKISSGGFIAADNVLWSGKVVAEVIKDSDKDTKAIMDFNDFIHQDDRVENVLVPIRDGIMLVRKK